MSLPEPDPRAVYWGLERRTGGNGEARWERVQIVRDGNGNEPNEPKGWLRWFPLASYSEGNIRAACGPGTYRVTWQPASRKAHWPPSDPFVVQPEQIPEPGPVTVEPAKPTPPTTANEPATTPAPPIRSERSALATVPPGYVQRPPPGYMPAPVDPPFERYHHLAGEDADRVTLVVTTLAASFQTAVAQMAAAVIATSGQRADDAQRLAHALMAQMAAPNPQLAMLTQSVQQQNAQLVALATAQQATTAKLEDLEAEADDPGPTPETTPTDGQKIMATLAPLAIEYGPKIAARLFPSDPTKTASG